MDGKLFQPANCTKCGQRHSQLIGMIMLYGRESVTEQLCERCAETHIINIENQMKELIAAGNHLHNDTNCTANCEWVRAVNKAKSLIGV